MSQDRTIHQFCVEGIKGDIIDFAAFKGKKIMVVNVASACGFTPQYKQLQELYASFSDRLVVVGFPCNDFGNQESGTETEIAAFCEQQFGVSFPLSRKISILQAPMHPVYQWLTQKSKNGVADSQVDWNFQKYLIDEEGRLAAMYSPSESPIDERILDWIQN